MNKAKSKKFVLFFLAILSMNSASEFGSADAFVAEATEVIGVIKIGVSLVDYIYKVFSHIFEDSGVSDSDLLGAKGREMQKELLTEYKVISAALDRFGKSNYEVQSTLLHMQRSLPFTFRCPCVTIMEAWNLVTAMLSITKTVNISKEAFSVNQNLRNDERELKLDRMNQIISSLASSYKNFEMYQENKDNIEQHTLEDFATEVLSHSKGSVRSSLNELHSLIVPHEGGVGSRGIFHMMAEGFQQGSELSFNA